jgi:hypothetical protein
MLHIYLSFRFTKPEDIDKCNSSCNNNNSNVSSVPYQSTCFCSQCHLYADCCRNMAHIKQQQASFECNIKTSDNEMTFSLTRCPSWWSLELSDSNKLIQRFCERPSSGNSADNFSKVLTRIPVFNQRTDITYKNLFCARCNLNESDLNEIKFFNLRWSIKNMLKYGANITKEIAEEILLDDDEQHIFKPPSSVISLRQCFQAIDYCPTEGISTPL